MDNKDIGDRFFRDFVGNGMNQKELDKIQKKHKMMAKNANIERTD